MAKLDEGVARVAVVIGGRDRAEMERVAAEVAGTLSTKELRLTMTKLDGIMVAETTLPA